MKNSIKILATVGLVFLLSFSMYAQTDNWSGAWNTKYGKVTITKNANGFTGTFRYGKLTEGREQDGMLLGRYIRNSRTPLNTSLGNKGEFRFILSADKTKFDGYHKSETDARWGSDNWNGVKVWGTVMPVIVSSNLPTMVIPTWTGTWETDTCGRFKIWDTGANYKNSTAIRIEGQFLIKGGGDFIDIITVEGYHRDYSPKEIEGTFTHGNRGGNFIFKFGSPTDDDFTGYLDYPAVQVKIVGGISQPYVYAKRVYVKGKRTSSSKPNMNTY